MLADAVPNLSHLTEGEREELAKKTLRVLVFGQAMGSAGFGSSVAVGGLIVKDILGGDTYAGSASAVVTIGGAAASLILAGLMSARGRRIGLVTGYAAAIVGALICVVGAQNRNLAVFLFGCLLFGQAQGANQSARFAAADLAPPDQRGQYISNLMFASTFGAVLGPVFVGQSQRIGTALGLWKYTGPYLVALAFFAAAAINTYARLRPDPLIVAGGLDPSRGVRLPPVRQALRVVSGIGPARLAMGSVVAGHTVMVAIMTMTPVHMKDHGHSLSLSGGVIGLHIAGMYALSPIVGRWSDRVGRVPVMLAGGAILLGAGVVTATAGYEPVLLFIGLFLLGLGWSCLMVSGSALLSESVPSANRVAVQGTSDLMMGLCGAAAGFGSGFVKRAWGFHVLSQAGAVVAIALVVILVRMLRAPAASPA
jgi:MFS family permease